jgi:uncharacterized protein YcaQ
MVTVHQLSRQDARRIAVRAQVLTSQRPPDLLTAVRRLTALQLDPVSAVAPSADLVAWSRLGTSHPPEDLKAVLGERHLIELQAFLRPAEDFALYRAEMAAWPGTGTLRDWQVFLAEAIGAEIASLAAWLGLEIRRA